MAKSVKIDDDQYEALRELADKHERKINGELRRAIRWYLEQEATKALGRSRAS